MEEIKRLEELLRIAATSKESRFFPPTANVEYRPDGHSGHLRVKCTYHNITWLRTLSFRSHSLEVLKQLALWVDIPRFKYLRATKPELIELLESQLLTYIEFKTQTEELLATKKEAVRILQEKEREAEERRAWERQIEVEKFHSSLKVEKLIDRHKEYLVVSKSNCGLNLYTLDADLSTSSENSILEELKISPATYHFLLNLEDKFKEKEEEAETLRKKLKRVQKVVEEESGYDSSGSD